MSIKQTAPLLVFALGVLALIRANSASTTGEAIYTLPFSDSYSITCGFGCYYGHQGTDIVVGTSAAGSDVAAAADGTAYHFDDPNVPGAGLHVSIDHGNGNRTRYLHLQDWTLSTQGQFFGRGEVIGHEGDTGTDDGFVHLHFETRIDSPAGFGDKVGTGVDPFDPNAWLWTTDPPSYAPPPTPTPTPSPTPVPCNAPPGGVVDGGLYRELNSSWEYIAYDDTRYRFASDGDFEDMGFSWDDLVCVPSGYWAAHPEIGTVPPAKTLVQEFQTSTVYLVQCNARFNATSSWQDLVSAHHANSPVRLVPPGSTGGLPLIPERACFSRMHPDTTNYYVACYDAGAKKWLIPASDIVTQITEYENVHVLPPNALDSYSAVFGPTFCEDVDLDGYADPREMYLGTRWDDDCGTWGAETWSKAWPPDLIKDNSVNISDVLALKQYFNQAVPSPAPYRFDLVYSGIIDISDVLSLKIVFSTSCVDDGPSAPVDPNAPPSPLKPLDFVAIDTQTAEKPANTANSIGTVEYCASVGVKGSLVIDVVVPGVPAVIDGLGGLRGFQFALNYDNELLHITGSDIAMMMSDGGGALLPLGDATPDSDGLFFVAVADFAPRPAVSGDGVLVRITLQGLAEGTSALSLTDVMLSDESNNVYPVDEIRGGELVVGGSCEQDEDDRLIEQLVRKLERVWES